MADVKKMAAILLLSFIFIIETLGHNEDPDLQALASSVESNDVDGTSLYRRKEDYEGMPIDVDSRRVVRDEVVTTTTTTTPASPPLDPRYRRIYNPDERAVIEDYPFMAAVLVNRELWCGGAVIDRDRIVTAAHCLQLQYNNRFFREYVKMVTVRVGSTNATYGGEVLKVVEINFHPNYKPATLEFNVAVLRVHKNISFEKKDSFVQRIGYSRDLTIPADTNIYFLGWGSVLGGGGVGGTVLLQKLKMPVYDLADCQSIYGRDLVTRNNFCAGFITLPKNVCNHDAGGPAVMDGVLVGILSFSSKRCDIPDQPAVFSTIGVAADWLAGLGEGKPRFYQKFGIPGIVGCLDGTHIAIVKPAQFEERFFNRKRYHSLNAQVVCDSDLTITSIDASYGGANHDSFIWNHHPLKRHLERLHQEENETLWFLGDSGYPLRPTLMTPIVNTEPVSPQRYYTNIHCRARNTVERCIGVLKSRWRCLLVDRKLHYHPTTAGLITNACVVLHNICNVARLPVPPLTPQEEQREIAMQIRSAVVARRGDHLAAGESVRNALVERLWSAR